MMMMMMIMAEHMPKHVVNNIISKYRAKKVKVRPKTGYDGPEVE